MTWKRFWIAIVSILSLAGTVKLVVACAGGDPDPVEEPSFFFNTVPGQPQYTPFYYTPYLVHFTDQYRLDSMYNYHTADANIQSWKKITAGAVSEADIDSFVYAFTAADMQHIFEHIRKEYTLKVPPAVAKNGFTQWLIRNRNHEIPLYLSFAKKCQKHALPAEQYWDDAKYEFTSKRRDSAAMQELVHEGINLYHAATNPDIKLRYAYQAMRMAFYSGEYPQTLLLFGTLLPPASTHYLYYRCLALRAGALYRTGRKSEAAYYYTHVFDSSDELKTQAHLGFRWATGGNVSNVLLFCKTDHDRAVLYLMRGLYDYIPYNYYERTPFTAQQEKEDVHGMYTTISTAYTYDPAVHGLEVLMTRYLNRIEMRRIPQIAQQAATGSSLEKLNELAQKIAHDGRRGQQTYWTLAAAYLYLLDGDMPNAGRQLEKANSMKQTPEEEGAAFVLGTLYALRRQGSISPTTEKELLPRLQQIEEQAYNDRRYRALFATLMRTVMQPMYLQQRDTIRALLAYGKANAIYSGAEPSYFGNGMGSDAAPLLDAMSPAKMHEMQAFVQQPDKSTYDIWLSNGTPYSATNLYELEGTKLIGLLQFGQAVMALKKVPEATLNKTLLPDMLVSHLSEKTQWNRSDSAVTYNRLSFALRMYELQRKLTESPTDARAAYQYANGLYSMSYYGKGWQASACYRSSAEWAAYYRSNERRKTPSARQQYYSVAMAEHYYNKAFEHSTDPEVKARCLFLAAKCRQKNCPIKETGDSYFSGDEKAYYRHSLESPYFTQLKEDFGTTIFYRQAVTNCSYLQDYLDSHK